MAQFNSFVNNYLFFKFSNKCQKEILRCAPSSSHVCDFCYTVAFDAQLMIFFIWRKDNALFSRYLYFRVFVKPTDFKICDVIICIATWWKLHFCLFLLNPRYYKKKLVKYLCAVWETLLTCFWLNVGAFFISLWDFF